MVVEADFAVGNDFFVLRQTTEFAIPAIEDMLHFVWMNADGGVDEGMLFSKVHCCQAGREIAADGDEGFDTGFPGACNHRLAILIVTGVVEMRMGIDQHMRHRNMELGSPESARLLSLEDEDATLLNHRNEFPTFMTIFFQFRL